MGSYISEEDFKIMEKSFSRLSSSQRKVFAGVAIGSLIAMAFYIVL